jgi:hypothetical protein
VSAFHQFLDWVSPRSILSQTNDKGDCGKSKKVDNLLSFYPRTKNNCAFTSVFEVMSRCQIEVMIGKSGLKISVFS